MRPSDMDAIARVLAQQVKEIVDKRLGDVKAPDPVDTSHLDAEIADLKKDNANLTKALDNISITLEAANVAIKNLASVVDEDRKKAGQKVNKADLSAIEARLADYCATDELVAVDKRLDTIEKVLVELPTPKDAEPVDVEALREDVLAVVRKEMPEAPLPLEPTALQVIEAVKVLYPSIRHDLAQKLPSITHKGVWSVDAQYDVGDEVIKNGSTFRLMEQTMDAPPSEAWQMIAMSKAGKQGKQGNKGDKGDRGDDGVGVDDVLFEDGQFVVNLTNDDTKIFNIDLPNMIAEAVKSFMLDVKGENDAAP